jgi:hypothetical protein
VIEKELAKFFVAADLLDHIVCRASCFEAPYKSDDGSKVLLSFCIAQMRIAGRASLTIHLM